MTDLSKVVVICLLLFFVTTVLSKLERIQNHPNNDDVFNNDDYEDEILHGHRIRDPEKHKRQQGCLCVNRFRDPHCGSDFKTYDNGCYFECAQKRSTDLKLLRWGKC